MEYAGNYYGTSFESLKDNSYMILDITGYLKYKNSDIPTKSFFFKTDKKEREKRMIKRGDKTSDVIERLSLDDIAFDISKIDFDGYIIDSTNLSIEEVSEQVYSLYNKKC
jgi:guanylate kinase